MSHAYPEPTASLLTFGDPTQIQNPNDSREWPDYIKKFGFALNDVPHLIQMLKDPTFRAANANDPIVWAELHAWRVLGQLQAVDAIEALLHCLDYDEENEDLCDWTMEEIPIVLGKMGVAAIEPLSHYNRIRQKDVGALPQWGVL